MRKLKLFFACMLMTLFSVGQVWAAEVTYKLTINADDFNTTSYAANNNAKTTDAVCTTDNTKTYEVTWTSNQVMKNGTNMQWQKSKGYIYNSTDLGTITNVAVTSSAGSFTTYYGTSEQPSSGSAGAGKGYFKTSVGGATGTTSKVEITFTINESETPQPSLSVAPTVIDFGTVEQGTTGLEEAVAVTFANLTGSVSYTGLSGAFSATGNISSTGDEITIAANTSTVGEYEQTLTVTSAADNKSATVTVTMNVVAPFNGLQLTFPDQGTEGVNVSSYTTAWSAIKGTQTWSIYGFNTNKWGWTPAVIKTGRKNNSGTAQPLTATIATQVTDHAIGDIVVTVDAVTAAQITSHKLYVADNSEYTNAIEVAGDPATIAVGNITYTVPDANRANNLYYKLEYATAGTASGNGTLTISKITYAYAAATPQKLPAGLAYNAADQKKLVKLGDAFTAPTLANPTNLTGITYASSDATVVEVNSSTGAIVEIKKAGVVVITASRAEDDTYKAGSASYTIGVTTHAGTEADPYVAADAKIAIDAMGTVENAYATGVVSNVVTTELPSDGYISFYFSADGLTSGQQIEAYKCYGLNSAPFEALTDVVTGATVVVTGTLKKYNSTYEFDQNCHLVSYTAPAAPKQSIANEQSNPYTVAQAITFAADGVTYDLDDFVYVQGVVYNVTSFNNGEMNIFIKDANAENQFELYKCAGINDGSSTTPFGALTDVQVGNIVIGYGQLTVYNTMSELKQGNYLVDLQKPATGVQLDATAEVEVGSTVNLTATILPSNATGTIVWTVESGSDKASVDAGVVTGIAEGTATVRATVQGTEIYAGCTVTVTAALAPLTDYYEKVTETAGIVEGTYLIVYEDESVAFDGGLETLDAKNNTIAVVITSENKIGVTTATEAATFYIDPTAGTIQAANGKYIGVTSNSNGLKTSDNADAYSHNFSIDDDDNAVIAAAFEGSTMSLRFNKGASDKRFRYYSNAGQQPIALYKLANETVKASPELTWSAESVELTVGDDFTSPTFTHADGLTETITFSSDKESVATVDANGVISLVADATGTAHITASYPGDANFKSGSAVCTIKVNPAHSIYVDKLNVNFSSVVKDAALPTSQTITVTLNNVAAATATLGGTNPDAFSVDKTALTESGDITISVVSSATVGEFKATLTISDDASVAASKEVKLSFTVTDPASEETPISTSTEWVAATEIADGMQVLITGVKDEVVYAMGEQKSTNRAAYVATLNEGVLTPGEGTMAFTLVAQGDGTYAIRTSNGKYLYAAKNDANHLKTQDEVDVNAKWTLSVTSAVATGSSNRNVMQFNGGSSKLFSCYSSASQEAIQFYVPKPATPPTPAYTDIRTGLTAGNYYTVCWPKAMTQIKGGSLWSFAGKDASTAYLIQEEAPFVAGRPYIIYATSTKLEAVVEGDDVTAGSYNGLHGTLDNMSNSELLAAGATYMLKDNALRPVGAGHLNANRAYVILDEISGGAPTNAPAHKVRSMPLQKDAATGIEDLNASEKPVKMVIDGQLYILRGEKMYDATGRLVK